MIIVLIGPMGCGKTTVGKLLAQRLRCRFDDADDFHPRENIKKMQEGIPLEDSDRAGWLKALRHRIEKHIDAGQDLVLACSALKESYRKILGVDQKCVISVYLKGSHEILAERIKMREHRFMNKGLLDSQLAAMEAPRDGVVIDITMTPDRICRQIIGRLEQIEEITRPPSA